MFEIVFHKSEKHAWNRYNTSIQSIVPVKFEQLKKETTHSDPSLELTVNGFSIHVTESTSDELLERVLQVAANVK